MRYAGEGCASSVCAIATDNTSAKRRMTAPFVAVAPPEGCQLLDVHIRPRWHADDTAGKRVSAHAATACACKNLQAVPGQAPAGCLKRRRGGTADPDFSARPEAS